MTPRELKELKGKRRVCALTCYDYSSARVLDRAGVDVLLVGDSLGMVVLGYDDTKSVTMQDMLSHTAAVCRGAQKTLVVGDMPIGTYGSSQKALQNAKCFIDAGAHAVKLEGPVFEQARLLVENKVPVMGHLGLLPQTAKDYKVQGKTQGEGEKILKDAVALEKTGVFAIVLECVPSSLAKKITQTISVPTIGIGAGSFCDGQILVLNDVLGLYDKLSPKFVKKYADLGVEMQKAVEKYKEEVLSGSFPDKSHSYE